MWNTDPPRVPSKECVHVEVFDAVLAIDVMERGTLAQSNCEDPVLVWVSRVSQKKLLQVRLSDKQKFLEVSTINRLARTCSSR